MAGHLLGSINPDAATGAPVPSNTPVPEASERQREWDAMTGRETPSYEAPPGPWWYRQGTGTDINMRYPQEVVSALIAVGVLNPIDRSDTGKVAHAIQRALDVVLHRHISV